MSGTLRTEIPEESFFSLLRRAVRGEDGVDYTAGSINRAVVLLAVPMVLEMAMESVFAVCDVFYVSRLGVDAVAAVVAGRQRTLLVARTGFGKSAVYFSATRMLRDRGWVGQDTEAVLGAEDISLAEMATTLTEVLGTPIRYERGSRDETKNTLIGYGFSDVVAQAFIDMDAAKENGLDLTVPRTPENTTPTTFRQFAEEVIAPAFAG